jgi:hypothetical protein
MQWQSVQTFDGTTNSVNLGSIRVFSTSLDFSVNVAYQGVVWVGGRLWLQNDSSVRRPCSYCENVYSVRLIHSSQ